MVLFLGCKNDKGDQQNQSNKSIVELPRLEVVNHSYANLDEVHTTHLHLDLNVKFDEKTISGVARHTMENSGADRAIFDTKQMNIEKVTLGTTDNEVETSFVMGEKNELLGTPLIVDLEAGTSMVNIYYSTTPEAEALDWLSPELTASGKHPFLYTQGQAILTRSWVPLQDAPSNRITYSADVKVPSELMALMSATNPTEKNETGQYSFEMKQPIPSYLLALAVGELEYADLGNNCGVYAEPSLIDEAAYEFEDVAKMMTAAENLYGKYLWEQYDIIVLPYSFPFGGMENPRLTFATPTLIAGDQSLVSVIAHELAHSWSGNLVTNATWNDFWLNEGFTVYFENRIMESLYGKETADMLALIEFQELQESVSEMMEDGKEKDTHLKLDLEGRDPDDGMSDIAYVKGAFFLKTIEDTVGREKFDKFLNGYFEKHKFQTITTTDFVAYLKDNLLDEMGIEFNVDEWIYEEGIPANAKKIVSKRFNYIQDLAKSIKKEGKSLPQDIKRADYTTQEWLAFIRAFDGRLDTTIMKNIDEQLNFKACGNAEIMSEWYVLAIKSNYNRIRPDISKFLIKVGRRKFLGPIYTTLANADEDDMVFAKNVYSKARENYHSVSYNTIDKILGL
jgi:leukotriene A-4 hydrolase/aminopeptidase